MKSQASDPAIGGNPVLNLRKGDDRLQGSMSS